MEEKELHDAGAWRFAFSVQASSGLYGRRFVQAQNHETSPGWSCRKSLRLHASGPILAWPDPSKARTGS